MTSLNPSHVPSSSSARRGQAVHYPAFAAESDNGESRKYDSAGYPQSISRLEKEARREPSPKSADEIRQAEQASHQTQEKGALEGGPESRSLTTAAQDDAVYYWGRELEVDWKNVVWVTVRDQFTSPFFQGVFWGVFGIVYSALSGPARERLYSKSHQQTTQGRIGGGSGGTEGGGSVIGSPEKGGWWRKWVGSFAGGVETARA